MLQEVGMDPDPLIPVWPKAPSPVPYGYLRLLQQDISSSFLVLHNKPILERYRSTQPLKTILFHVLLVSVLY